MQSIWIIINNILWRPVWSGQRTSRGCGFWPLKSIVTLKQSQGHDEVKCLRQDQCQCQCPSWGHDGQFQLQEKNFTSLVLFFVVSYLSFSLAVSFSQDKYDCSLTPHWHRSSSWHCPYNCSCHTPGPPESGNGSGSSWRFLGLIPNIIGTSWTDKSSTSPERTN